MTGLRSGVLAAWMSAWFAGDVGPDEVVDATTGDDAAHQVAGLGLDLVALRDVLVTWRRAHQPVRLVLPVPGDLRGVPGPGEFRSAALDAGEAVCSGELALVPEITDYYPSSAPTSVVWHAHVIEPAPPDYAQLAEVAYELGQAIREAATALRAADVAGSAGDVADALHDARRAGEHLNLPPGFPSRAVALLAQAERMHAVLDLAAADPEGGAIDRFGMSARASALRPLEVAVRRARLAGYNARADISG
jgi:hypothetical protein